MVEVQLAEVDALSAPFSIVLNTEEHLKKLQFVTSSHRLVYFLHSEGFEKFNSVVLRTSTRY